MTSPARTRTVEHALQTPGTDHPVCGKTLSIRLNTSGYINGGTVQKIRTTYVTTALAADPVPGKFSIPLEVNDDIDPAGTYYTIAIFSEILAFVVPAGTGTVTLRDCLVTNPVNPNPVVLPAEPLSIDGGTP